MTIETRWYVNSQPSNMTMRVIIVVSGVSLREAGRMAKSHLSTYIPENLLTFDDSIILDAGD